MPSIRRPAVARLLCSAVLASLLVEAPPPRAADHTDASAPSVAAAQAAAMAGQVLAAQEMAAGNSEAGSEAEPSGPPAADPAASSTAPPAADPWAATVELYGFAPLRTTGETTVRGFSTETDLSLGEALPLLEFGMALRASVERDRLGLLTDLSYVRLGAERTRTIETPGPGGLSGRGELTTIQGVYDVALRYRFGEREAAIGRAGHFSVIPYAGIRIVQAELGVLADLNDGRLVKEGTLDRVWVQPLLGTQAGVFVSPRLQLFARADVGGFGLSGSQDLSGNAQLGLAYAVGNNTQLRISWRYFGIAYNNGETPDDNGFTSNQNGIELGLKVLF